MLIDDASVNCRAAELLGMKSYMPQQRRIGRIYSNEGRSLFGPGLNVFNL